MIIKVVPKIKLPLGAEGVFDYETDLDNVSPGQIVLVEFRRRVVAALVLETRNKKLETRRFKLKPILRVLDEKPMVSEREIGAMRWMSEYYFTALSNVVRMMVPDVPRKGEKRKEKRGVVSGDLKLMVLRSRLEEIKKTIEGIVKADEDVLFVWNDLREKFLVYIKLIEHYLSLEQPVLIILPQVSDIEFLAGFLRPKFDLKIAILHARRGKKAQYMDWRRIQQNRAKIILGTRSAILAPLTELGLVIIDEEEAKDHKQSDMNPRYDARRIAERLGVKVVYSSSAPRVETYFKIPSPKIKLVMLMRDLGRVELVDVANESVRGEYSGVSLRLEREMRLILGQDKKVVLFLNRKGMATMIVCKDCQYLFKCEQCGLPRVYHQQAKQMVCHHCGKREEIPLTCPKCSRKNIKFVGLGTERVEKEVRKLFPDKKVLRIDKEATYYKLEIERYDIIVGTQLLLKDFRWIRDVGLLGIVSLDIMLTRPDFRASEKLYQLVSKILVWARYNKVGKVLWQTYFFCGDVYDDVGHYPAPSIINLAARQDYERFFKQEIEMREKLGYPPFLKLVKFIYKDAEQKKAWIEAARLVGNLRELRFVGMQVIGPIEPLVNKAGKNYIVNVILKAVDLRVAQRIPVEILRGWLVDVEPEDIT